jgi:hypothetical protein
MKSYQNAIYVSYVCGDVLYSVFLLKSCRKCQRTRKNGLTRIFLPGNKEKCYWNVSEYVQRFKERNV